MLNWRKTKHINKTSVKTNQSLISIDQFKGNAANMIIINNIDVFSLILYKYDRLQ